MLELVEEHQLAALSFATDHKVLSAQQNAENKLFINILIRAHNGIGIDNGRTKYYNQKKAM